jgi:hypothetical protein
MFGCINERLSAQDQDQEVKEAAISAMAALLARCGDMMQGEVRVGAGAVAGLVSLGVWTAKQAYVTRQRG